MGIRFRRSINIGGGLKLNLNKKSVGLSFGVKGAHASINTKGQKTTSVGIPGSGISYVSRSKSKTIKNDLIPSESKVPFYLSWMFIAILCLTLYGILPAMILIYLRLKYNKSISSIITTSENE